MADLIIQPKNDDHLKLNNDAGTTILELANDESKLRLAQNNISASDGTTAITTSGANVTLAGTANNIGTVTSGTFNGTIGTSATGGNSTEFPRNIDVSAMTSNVSHVDTGAEQTIFTATYTPKISGTSRIYADLYLHMFTGANQQDTRLQINVEITGSGITDRVLNSNNNFVFGAYDYGASGMQVRYASTLLCPRVTSSDTQTITFTLKMTMASASSTREFSVLGNSDETETHFRFMEVA